MSYGMSTFDTIKLVVGALGCMATGALIAFVPIESLRVEIPYYFEIGAGFMAWGVLLIVALFVVRVKALLLFAATTLLAAGCGLAAYGAGPASWQFYVYGVLATGIFLFALSCLHDLFTGRDPARF